MWKKNLLFANYKSVIPKTNGVSSSIHTVVYTLNWNARHIFLYSSPSLVPFCFSAHRQYKHLIMDTKDEIYGPLNGNIMPWICFAILQYTTQHTQYVNNFLIFISTNNLQSHVGTIYILIMLCYLPLATTQQRHIQSLAFKTY